MNTLKDTAPDARQMRRRLDDMEALLERLLELPLPTRLKLAPESPPPRPLNERPDHPASTEQKGDLETPAPLPFYSTAQSEAVPKDPRPALAPVKRLETPPPVVEATVPMPLSRDLSEVPAIATISKSVLAPSWPWYVKPLVWTNRLAEYCCPWLARPGVKTVLGWLGFVLAAGAAALAVGRLLGQRWLP